MIENINHVQMSFYSHANWHEISTVFEMDKRILICFMCEINMHVSFLKSIVLPWTLTASLQALQGDKNTRPEYNMKYCSTWLTLFDEMLLAGIILCMDSANERQGYIVTSSLTGWAHTQNAPCVGQWYYSQNISPREPHALAWGPSSFHTKIFRVERTRLKTVEKITESL